MTVRQLRINTELYPSARRNNRRQRPVSESQLQTAGQGALVPIVYGRDRIGGQVLNAALDGRYLVVHVQWCIGGYDGIDAIEEIQINGKPLPTTATVTNYFGTTTQGIDPTLAGLIDGYADTLVATIKTGAASFEPMGIAYSVIRLYPNSTEGFPEFAATVRGLQVVDTRVGGARVFSSNPSLVLHDFLTSALYGWGRTVDAASANTCADSNDELLEGLPRRTIGLTITQRQKCNEIADTLRTYAGVLLSTQGDTIFMIADRPAAVARTLNDSSIYDNTMRVSRKRADNSPTVINVAYTRTDEVPWKQDRVQARLVGVDQGTEPWIESDVSMPGIHDAAEAYRFGVERVNRLALIDLEGSHQATPEALVDTLGDVLEITHRVGFVSKQVRLMASDPSSAHSVSQQWVEYDPAVYSDAVQAPGPPNDIDLPDPLKVPAAPPITVIERPFTDEAGKTFSTLVATWQGVSWPFAARYRVLVNGQNIDQETTIEHRGDGVTHTFVSYNVKQAVTYSVNVWVVSTLGGQGDPSIGSLEIQGKLLNPSDVPFVSGFEAGQFVHLRWGQAQDEDLAGYQIVRWNPGAGETLDDAVVLVKSILSDQVLIPNQPEGIYRYGVFAHDTRYDYSDNWDRSTAFSPNPATTDIEITADRAGSQLTADFFTESLTLTNMSLIEDSQYGRCIIPDYGEDWGADVAWNSEYDHWIFPYQSVAAASEFQTNELDAGQDLRGHFSGNTTYFDFNILTGVTQFAEALWLATEAAYPTFTESPGRSIDSTARYMYKRVVNNAPDVNSGLIVALPVTLAVARETRQESGTVYIDGNDTITFSRPFPENPQIFLTVEATNGRFATYDAVTPTQFDIYVWLGAISTAANVSWTAIG